MNPDTLVEILASFFANMTTNAIAMLAMALFVGVIVGVSKIDPATKKKTSVKQSHFPKFAVSAPVENIAVKKVA